MASYGLIKGDVIALSLHNIGNKWTMFNAFSMQTCSIPYISQILVDLECLRRRGSIRTPLQFLCQWWVLNIYSFSWWRALLTAETNFIVVPTRILLLSRTPVNLALGNNLILCSLIVLCQFSVLYFCWIPVDKNYLLVVLFCYQPLYYLVPFGNLEWACKRKWMTKGFYSNANMLKLLPFLVIWLLAIHLWS